jgi:hypothetical protein
MTKRSVILVGVLICMVALGSTVIGVVSSKAATEAANGTHYSFLPLVMKAFQAGTSPTYFFAGNADEVDIFGYVAPNGVSADTSFEASRAIMSPPTDCIAKDFSASLLQGSATLHSDYGVLFRLFYRTPGSSTWIFPGGNPAFCEILDPAMSCVSSSQITIPARSEIIFEVWTWGIEGRINLPFSWICEGT